MRLFVWVTFSSLLPFVINLAEATERGRMIAFLEQYEGRWVGTFTIHSEATGYTQELLVEQRYWWSDNALRGLSVAETAEGSQTATSRAFFSGEALRLEVSKNGEVEVFAGVLDHDRIIWVTANPARLNDYQFNERFVQEGLSTILVSEGFDTYDYEDDLAYIIYKGRMVKVPE